MAKPSSDFTSMSDLVATEIRRGIIQGELQPGERLTETRIAQDLGVSRGPVREGLRELGRDGLVMAYPNRGVIVMPMTDDELLRLLLPIRLVLEDFSATLLSPVLTKETIFELDGLLKAMQDAANAGDANRVSEADIAFHSCVIRASGSGHALQLWQSIYARTQAQINRIGRRRDLADVPREHKVLRDALVESDVEILGIMLEQHIVHDAHRYLA